MDNFGCTLGQGWSFVKLTEIQSHSLDRANHYLDRGNHSWGWLKFGPSLRQGWLLVGVIEFWLHFWREVITCWGDQNLFALLDKANYSWGWPNFNRKPSIRPIATWIGVDNFDSTLRHVIGFWTWVDKFNPIPK